MTHAEDDLRSLVAATAAADGVAITLMPTKTTGNQI